MIALTRILVPTNLGEPSRAALRYGVAFARQFKAKLFLLQVLPENDYETAIEAERVVEEFVSDGQQPAPNAGDVLRAVARADLRQLLDEEDERATQAEYLIRPGTAEGPHRAIVRCASELRVELIVIGKHGLGRVERMIGGSVTEKLLREAPCPVMVIRQAEHEFVLPDPVEDVESA